jgi:hypothetical protein
MMRAGCADIRLDAGHGRQRHRRRTVEEDAMSNALTRTPVPDYAGSSWARGLSDFAATMMIVVGAFEFFEGLVAVVNGDDFLLTTRNYLVQFDATSWGWTHLVIGLVVAATGLFILNGNRLARGVGIGVACVAALANFMWIPYYPLWALVVLTLDVAVIWALTTSNLAE